MATFNKFYSFAEALAEKVHNLGTDDLKIALTNVAPVATNTVFADITEIATGSRYPSGGVSVTVVSSGQAGGVYSLIISDINFAASGDPIGPYRYAVLYNDTATNKELIGWWDRGSSTTVDDGDPLILELDQINGVVRFS